MSQFENEFNGPAYTKKTYETAEKFNPSRLVHKWKTPMLVVHGSKDYRLPETEGLSVFNALQRYVTFSVVNETTTNEFAVVEFRADLSSSLTRTTGSSIIRTGSSLDVCLLCTELTLFTA